jgi:hypothetical protein
VTAGVERAAVGDGERQLVAARTRAPPQPEERLRPAAADAILRRRARAPYRNVFELAPSLPEPARTAVRERIGAFLARLAFDPRDVELTVQARAPGAAIGAELHAAVTLTGGAGLRLNGVIER